MQEEHLTTFVMSNYKRNPDLNRYDAVSHTSSQRREG
jgi:hypothetical protein